MAGWIERVSGLLGNHGGASRSDAARSPVRASVPRTVPARAPTAPAGEAPTDLQIAFFDWLLELGPTPDAALTNDERRLLARLDELIADSSTHAALLPRASSVVPQLLGCLRDQSLSNDGLVRQITKDAHLVAETIRIANGVGSRSTEPVSTLPEAVNRLGIIGLQRVISRVLLKPIFAAHSDALSARAAPRLWQHSEAKADACAGLANSAGFDAFDGYLAGLMHNVGWSAALRAIDRCPGVSTPPRFTSSFVRALEARRERLFAVLTRAWGLSPAISALAVELLDGVPLAQRGALGRALGDADSAASQHLLGIGPSSKQ